MDDLKRLHELIEPHSTDAAKRAVDTLIEAAETLAEFPEKGRPWNLEMDFRELPVRFGARGYVIRYRHVGEEVIIVRVWHALEKPLINDFENVINLLKSNGGQGRNRTADTGIFRRLRATILSFYSVTYGA